MSQHVLSIPHRLFLLLHADSRTLYHFEGCGEIIGTPSIVKVKGSFGKERIIVRSKKKYNKKKTNIFPQKWGLWRVTVYAHFIPT